MKLWMKIVLVILVVLALMVIISLLGNFMYKIG